jgi:hypothetical protein
MNDFDTTSIDSGNEKENSRPSPPIRSRPPAGSASDRLAELEMENSRLHRLVAELLIKNQQLRKPD